jgi:hypothetical protein
MAVYMQSVITEMTDLNSARVHQEENPAIERFLDPAQDPIETYIEFHGIQVPDA